MATTGEDIEDWNDLMQDSEASAPDVSVGASETAVPTTELQQLAESDAAIDRDQRPVLDGIRDLRDSLASYQSLEHSLVELCKSTEIHQSELAEQLAGIRSDLAVLRQSVENAAPRQHFAKASRRFRRSDPLHQWRLGRTDLTPQPREGVIMLAVIVIGILLLGWSVSRYVQTGSVLHAVFGLVVVNLAGAATVFLHRRGA